MPITISALYRTYEILLREGDLCLEGATCPKSPCRAACGEALLVVGVKVDAARGRGISEPPRSLAGERRRSEKSGRMSSWLRWGKEGAVGPWRARDAGSGPF